MGTNAYWDSAALNISRCTLLLLQAAKAEDKQMMEKVLDAVSLEIRLHSQVRRWWGGRERSRQCRCWHGDMHLGLVCVPWTASCTLDERRPST